MGVLIEKKVDSLFELLFILVKIYLYASYMFQVQKNFPSQHQMIQSFTHSYLWATANQSFSQLKQAMMPTFVLMMNMMIVVVKYMTLQISVMLLSSESRVIQLVIYIEIGLQKQTWPKMDFWILMKTSRFSYPKQME